MKEQIILPLDVVVVLAGEAVLSPRCSSPAQSTLGLQVSFHQDTLPRSDFAARFHEPL